MYRALGSIENPVCPESGYDITKVYTRAYIQFHFSKDKMAATLRAFLKSRPLLTNCATYGGLYMAAEFSQQTLLKKGGVPH